jgi:hypothetical protein
VRIVARSEASRSEVVERESIELRDDSEETELIEARRERSRGSSSV